MELTEVSEKNRVVVFTGDLSYSVRRGILEVDRLNPDLMWLVVLHAPSKSFSTLLSNQYINLKRNGWRWIPCSGAEIVNKLTSKLARKLGLKVGKVTGLSPASLSDMPNLEVLVVNDLHDSETLNKVQAYKPKLGLSLAAPILKSTIFSIPEMDTINLHKGHLPYYRGMPPAFWELWNNEKNVGCSVHWVEEKLDAGAVLQKALVPIVEYSTLRGLQLRLDEVGVELTAKAVTNVLAGDYEGVPQAQGGNTYRKPTLRQQAVLKRRLQHHERSVMNSGKTYVKNTVAYSMFLFSRLLVSRAAPRITVILYHRVTDEVRDNLTVGVEQFDRQMGLLKKYFHVLSIDEVMNSGKIAPSKKPMVCVTFDDGYLDNYSNAAPILMKHGLPAAFFISTGIVNSTNSFPHDDRRGNAEIPKMTWDDLRKMKEWGFTIGSHTVNHIDCAAEAEERVLEELQESRDELKEQLGLSGMLFAYPYGGKQHMTEQRLALVKQEGYSGCLSAYGGVNINSVDRFNVLRRGIHWEFSDQAFLLESMGVR